jgi:hypothetical protein
MAEVRGVKLPVDPGHVAMVFRTYNKNSPQEIQIIHSAAGKGLKLTGKSKGLPEEFTHVFRLKSKKSFRHTEGDRAVKVADIWSTRSRTDIEGAQQFGAPHIALSHKGFTGGYKKKSGDLFFKRRTEPTPYSMTKAVRSAFTRSNFGLGAKKRAKEFRDHASSIDGPPSFSKLHKDYLASLSKKNRKDLSTIYKREGVFCSMMIIAVYQAIMNSTHETKNVMGLDALHTTPHRLLKYLQDNTTYWQQLKP